MKAQRNGEDSSRAAARSAAPREFLELWIHLSRKEWGSLVIIPADAGGSTAEIASGLAEIGQRLSYGPVTAVTVNSLEYGSALALADLQQHVERERRSGGRMVPAVNAGPEPGADAADPSATPTPAPIPSPTPTPGAAANGTAAPTTEALVKVPPARLIISVPSVISEPLGLTAAAESDAVVLAVRMNRSRMSEVRRTIQLVGRERILGCFVIR